MLKFKLLFGKNKLEFTDIDVALRSAFALSENFNVHIGYMNNKYYITLKAMEKIFNIAGGTRCGYAISYDPDLVICTWGMLPSEIDEMQGAEFKNA